MRSKRKRFSAKHRFVYPRTEEITTKERQPDSIARLQCPGCKGELYISKDIFAKSGIKPDMKSINLIVVHCINCNVVCRIEKLEQEENTNGQD